MARFLTNSEIRHAVDQLGKSSARARLCELLIGLRTLKLVGADQAPVAESAPEYVQAVNEFTRWTEDDSVDSPYFNPFGAHASYKSKKFPSNGPSNTMHGWATQADSPFEIINARPKEIRRRSLSAKQLRAFVILGKGDGERPRLIDAAVWFYRSTNFDRTEWQYDAVQVQHRGERTFDREGLEMRFMEDLALDEGDAIALFRSEVDDGPEDAKPVAAAEDGSQSDEPLSVQDADAAEES
ncbi:hypothetical protein B1813_14645 [Saccharomonospora piscinae]|uniref:Uncharacterized protein n=1 Tax=Saccharomonospora piscinae TaxID=687388 RepID=A0A1V9A0U8_SACPI|nr:hypothetical protein [Saccharomonospora piscinae]OQO90767.1 hypothetical protein B1813_14645 [Saccharomonospora piscinae]